MMEYDAVRERQDAIRRHFVLSRLARDARRESRPALRRALGTRLARLGLWLAGPTAVRAVLGEAR